MTTATKSKSIEVYARSSLNGCTVYAICAGRSVIYATSDAKLAQKFLLRVAKGVRAKLKIWDIAETISHKTTEETRRMIAFSRRRYDPIKKTIKYIDTFEI